jgi:hypothetical protein
VAVDAGITAKEEEREVGDVEGHHGGANEVVPVDAGGGMTSGGAPAAVRGVLSSVGVTGRGGKMIPVGEEGISSAV